MDAAEVKKILRSLLVSSPTKLTVSKLNRDYRDIEGFNIPFKELGYNSLIHFLHSIPDVLKVNGSSFESEITLVVSEKTAHVNDMVLKQRKPKSKSRSSTPRTAFSDVRSNSRKSGSFEPMGGNFQSNQRRISPNGNIPSQFYNVNNFQLFRPPPLMNVNVQLFNLRPIPNLNIQLLNRGLNVNHRFSNSQSPFPKQVSSHSPLINKEKQSLIEHNEKLHLENRNVNKMQNEEFKKANEQGTKSNIFLPQENELDTTKSDGEVTKVLSKIEKLKMLKSKGRSTLTNVSEKTYSDVSVSEKNLKLKFLRSRAKSRVRNTELISCNSDVNEDENNYTRDFIQIEDDHSKRIPEVIKMRIKDLISHYPHGMLCSELLTKYSEMFKNELEYQQFGFHSVITFCIHLEDILHYVKDSSFDYKIYDKRKPILNIRMSYESEEKLDTKIIPEINPMAIEAAKSPDWEEYSNIIPKDVVELGEKVNYDVMKEFKVGDTIQIVISEIFHPEKFWIYKNDGLLDKLMNEIQIFYGENKKDLMVPEYLLEVGLYCVVHLNEFQRGIIVDLIPEVGGHVKVYFIDYGTLIDIPRMKVFFLKKEFGVLSAQAVKAKLANIKPSKDIWTKSSSLRFRDFISSKHVFAKISEIEDNVVSVYVGDNARPLKFVNSILVEEGFAEKIPSEKNIPKVSTPCMSKGRRMLLERIKMKNAASV